MVSILDYQNYREYLKDYYKVQKDQKTGFTYARFSHEVGIKSPNYYKLVMDGEKNLTPDNIARFSNALNLELDQSEYFEALVHFNQAKSDLEKRYYQDRMKRAKNRAKNINGNQRTLEEFEFEAVSSWLHHAILVLSEIDGFRESPKWIRERLYGLVSEEEIGIVLERLIELNLLTRDENGKLKMSHRQINTRSDLKRLSVQIFYEGLLSRAAQSLKINSSEEREFGAYLVGISRSQMPEIKKRVREFLISLNEYALENPNPSQVIALTFCGFPISNIDPRSNQ